MQKSHILQTFGENIEGLSILFFSNLKDDELEKGFAFKSLSSQKFAEGDLGSALFARAVSERDFRRDAQQVCQVEIKGLSKVPW